MPMHLEAAYEETAQPAAIAPAQKTDRRRHVKKTGSADSSLQAKEAPPTQEGVRELQDQQVHRAMKNAFAILEF